MSWFHYRPRDDRDLEAEIMVSDRLRAAIVGTALLVVAVLFLVVATQVGGLRGGPLGFLADAPIDALAGILAILGAYEFGYRFVIGRLLAHDLRLPLPPRFFNATVEVSIPTLILAVAAAGLPANEALNLPPVLVYFFFLALSTLRLDPKLAFFTGLVAGLEYIGLAWVLLGATPATVPADFLGAYVSKGVMMVVTGGLLSFVTFQIRKRVEGLLRTREQQSRMAAIFGQHVSPAVMEKLLTQKTVLESEVRHVTVMFLDIRNFTSFSEGRSPDQVVDYLNRLFGFMVDSVNAHQGIINKFLGDGFMAVFGAPLDDGRSELNAVRAALDIGAHLDQALAQGLEPTRIGIGLHSGRAVTGNVGSAQRQEYTIIGDVVNLASRIESHTKVAGARILASRSVWDAARTADPALGGEPIGPVTVKGREAPVDLVRLG